MARGRGGGMQFKDENFGFTKGEGPAAVLAPPPLFPPLVNKPLPITIDERVNELLRCKKQLRNSFLESEYYIKPKVEKNVIQKYSDKYRSRKGNILHKIDWSRFPKELKVVGKRNKSMSKNKPKPISHDDVLNKLKNLEEKEGADYESEDEDKEKEKDEDDDEQELNEEDYDEEEHEDGTDYVSSYFDNGEGYLEEDEDNLDDGPVY